MQLLKTYLYRSPLSGPTTFDLIYNYRRFDGYTNRNVYIEALGSNYPDGEDWFKGRKNSVRLTKEYNEIIQNNV